MAKVLRYRYGSEINLCLTSLPEPRQSSSSHTRFDNYAQAGVLTKGSARLRFRLGQIVDLPKGGWFLCTANELAPILLESDQEMSIVWIECSQVAWTQLLQPILAERKGNHPEDSPAFPPHLKSIHKGTAPTKLQELACSIENANGITTCDLLLNAALAIEFLATILKQASAPPIDNRSTTNCAGDSLQQAAAILEQNLSANHSLQSLSRQVHLNEFKLKRGFKERYKTTVFGYLRRKRMERARELLSSGKISVLRVAETVGYANPSHFARAFRASFGMNPKDAVPK